MKKPTSDPSTGQASPRTHEDNEDQDIARPTVEASGIIDRSATQLEQDSEPETSSRNTPSVIVDSTSAKRRRSSSPDKPVKRAHPGGHQNEPGDEPGMSSFGQVT